MSRILGCDWLPERISSYLARSGSPADLHKKQSKIENNHFMSLCLSFMKHVSFRFLSRQKCLMSNYLRSFLSTFSRVWYQVYWLNIWMMFPFFPRWQSRSFPSATYILLKRYVDVKFWTLLTEINIFHLICIRCTVGANGRLTGRNENKFLHRHVLASLVLWSWIRN